MNTRRNFIKSTLVTGAGALVLNPLKSMGMGGTNKLKSFGFIAGIAGKELKADWKGTLKKAVEFGFTEIEGGSNYADSPQEFLNYCKGIGIKLIASGASLSPMMEDPQKVFDQLNELKCKYVVVYWPWLVGGPFTFEDCKKSADLLNELGAKAKANNLKLLWHNHNKEFIEMEKGLPFDYLMLNTEPDIVNCEMDIYWVKKGGVDPLKMLKKYSGRYSILHVKDMAEGPEQDFVCPGSGIIDFAPIFKEAKKQGIEHYIVERDKEPNGIWCLESSGKFLSNLKF